LTFSAAMGVVFTMKALIVVIMGGVGNMLGALIAGLLLGISETAVARLVDPGLTIAVTYALFLGVLLWRPTGLFGRVARGLRARSLLPSGPQSLSRRLRRFRWPRAAITSRSASAS